MGKTGYSYINPNTGSLQTNKPITQRVWESENSKERYKRKKAKRKDSLINKRARRAQMKMGAT